MSLLSELQRNQHFTTAQPRTPSPLEDEMIVTDRRCEMSPAQFVEEKLLRAMETSKELFERTFAPRRPR